MEVIRGEEEGFIREWTPCTHMLNLIPPRVQNGLFSTELYLTCIDAVNEYIALGTNVGLVYWYHRKKGNIQRLRCEVTSSAITFVKIVNTVDYMVGAGNVAGQVTVFQIPKEHPENVPETLKPKVEPKVERYTIGDLHKSPITSIEWSKNGMRLFSGDKNGVIIMTEIDFYMHLCKSMEIVNEEHEIVQMSYWQSNLLVSSVYRTIICERSIGDATWKVNQVGKKERKSLCRLGAVWQHSYARGGAAEAYCARAGLRLWRTDVTGNVHQTLIFKEAVENPLTVAELLNPAQRPRPRTQNERNFGPLFVFREHFIVTHDGELLYVLDPRSLVAVAVVDDLRRILSVSVNNDEILVLEGPRSVVRLAHAPDAAPAAEEPSNLMTKSLTTSIQQAVNTVRDLTHIEQTVPFISSVLEPIALLAKDWDHDRDCVPKGEECFELPPIKDLPDDMSEKVLESIINEFKDVTDQEETKKSRSEELEKKLKLYNSIMAKQCEGELIHSRRSRRRDTPASRTSSASRPSTPARCGPAPAPAPASALAASAYTSPCLMAVSVYSNLTDDSDEKTLEKQIEEKEKILAKMLNLESLSIGTAPERRERDEPESAPTTGVDRRSCDAGGDSAAPAAHETKVTPVETSSPSRSNGTQPTATARPPETPQHQLERAEVDFVPKLAKIPNNWHLENLELRFDGRWGASAPQSASPDDHLDSEWEIV